MKITEVESAAADLDAMSVQAATVYYECAVKYGVGKYPREGVRKARNFPTFVKVARLCMHKGIDPSDFVEAAFFETMARHSVVTARDILSFKPEDINRDGMHISSSSPADLWNMLSCKLVDMVFSMDGVGKDEALDNPMYGFPAWFRVFSPESASSRLIAHWGDLAHEELADNAELKKFLKAKRPATHRLLSKVMAKVSPKG